jgi:hypothetical protein
MHEEERTLGTEQASQDTLEANALNRDLAKTALQDARDALYHLLEVPTFIYSYEYHTDKLYRTSLDTGEYSSHRVPSYTFMNGCCWSEVPGGSLLITGGEFDYTRSEVVRIDTCREFAVFHCAPMFTPRFAHAAVYHSPHL